MDIENLDITILPFIYKRSEWVKTPKTYVLEYLSEFKFSKFKLKYNVVTTGLEEGIHLILELQGSTYTLCRNFNNFEIAEQNIFILALVNIYGYCENAIELQSLIKECQHTTNHISISGEIVVNLDNENFKDLHRRKYLSKSLGSESLSTRDKHYFSKETDQVIKKLNEFFDELPLFIFTTRMAINFINDFDKNITSKTVKHSLFILKKQGKITKIQVDGLQNSEKYSAWNLCDRPVFS